MQKTLSLLALIVALAALGVVLYAPMHPQEAHKETAYERVLRTRTLRCAYMAWPQNIERDPNTGKFSGYFYDMMEAVAASMGIHVAWGPEIAVGTQIEALETGKADAICDDAPLQTGPTLQLAYTEPLAYFPVFAYVRTDDKRFTNDNNRVNAADIKVSMIDGDLSHDILQTLYTKAVPVPLPQLAEANQMMMDVVAKKADVVLNDPMSMSPFLQNNPGKLRRISDKPIILISASFSVLRTETALADMISQGTKNIRDRGVAALIDAKYGIGSKIAVYPPAKRYEGK